MCLNQVCYETIFRTVYINSYVTCSQKGETRTALHSLPNVNTNLLCCLAYMHARKTGGSLSLSEHNATLFSLVPRPPVFAHPQWYTAVKESLFHLGVLQGWPGNEAGRYGNEATYQEPAWVTSLSPTMCCSFTTPRLMGCLGNAWMFCKERYYEILTASEWTVTTDSFWGAVDAEEYYSW